MSTTESQKKPLNPNAQLWVDKLRSGEYQQGREFLSRGGKFCCLGVACELFAKENSMKVDDANGIKAYAGESEILPESVRHWLKLDTNNGQITGRDWLPELNDDGKTFAEIADIIESQPEGLFAK